MDAVEEPGPVGDAIVVQDLCKSFQDQQVLKGINLTAKRGQITTLMGASGSGKSVLVKHIIGLLRPDSGEIWVDGRRLSDLSSAELRALRTRFGFVFQNAALFDSMSVEENIGFPLKEHSRLKRREIRSRVSEILERLHLPGIEKKYPEELSGGMRKRVALARSLVMKPEFMIYDEPTTGLDPIMMREVDDMIRETQEDLGVTSLIISHDVGCSFRLSDRIAMLHEGTICLEGTPEEFRASADPIIRRFIYSAQIEGGS